MIYGMNNEQRREYNRRWEAEWARGVKRFAWFPERLHDGRMIWLETYYAYYAAYYDSDSTIRLYAGDEVVARTKNHDPVLAESLIHDRKIKSRRW